MRRVDLATVDDADCRDALERFERAGVAVAVWDITSRVGLPAFECLIAGRDDDPLWQRAPAGTAAILSATSRCSAPSPKRPRAA